MKILTLKLLESFEKIIKEDPTLTEIRNKIKKSIDNSPNSITIEEALKQFTLVKKFASKGETRR